MFHMTVAEFSRLWQSKPCVSDTTMFHGQPIHIDRWQSTETTDPLLISLGKSVGCQNMKVWWSHNTPIPAPKGPCLQFDFCEVLRTKTYHAKRYFFTCQHRVVVCRVARHLLDAYAHLAQPPFHEGKRVVVRFAID